MKMNIKYIQETETLRKTNLLNAVVILMKHFILHLLNTENKVVSGYSRNCSVANSLN